MTTIRNRLLISMALTGLVPLVVVLVPLGAILSRNLRQQEEDKLTETSAQLGRLIAEVTDRTARELSSLQTNPFFADPEGDNKSKLKEMQRLVRIFEIYTDISLYDQDGFLIGSTAEEHPAFREYSDWFRTALGGQISVSHPQRALGKDGLYLTVYLPIIQSEDNPKSAPHHVVKARLSFSRILAVLEETSIGKGNLVYLLDELGNTLSGGPPSSLLEKFDPETPATQWFENRTGIYTDSKGVPYLYASEVLSGTVTRMDTPWIILTMKPLEEVTAVSRHAAIALVLAALCMMIVAVSLGAFLSRRISRPLETIGAVAERVAAGDLAVQANEEDGSSEIRDLAAAFNRMVREITEHREGLEKLVASRTESLHQSQSELERANARLQAAIESTNNGFLVEDLSGKIVVVNDLFVHLLGTVPSQEFTATTLLDSFFKRGGFTSQTVEEWLQMRADGAVIDQEITLSLPEPRILHVHSAPIRDLRGSIVGRVWSTRDLTERRQLEEGLRQSQKMEAVGQLAGGIAHDFNNLLAGILGNLALVKMAISDTGNAEANESLTHAIKAGERAAELVKQLLGFSRRSRLDLRPCDANLVLTEVRDILSATIDRRIRIDLDLETSPWRAMADVGMLGQVIMNMAVNAKDAMPHGGTLRLRSSNRLLSAADLRAHPEVSPGEFVCLSVEDEGEGIPPEVQAKIFEPFFTTKEPGKGTGLGLATSFGIVKQLGGWIDFQSKVGEGTRFDIYLPRSTAAEASDTTALLPVKGHDRSLSPSRQGETILLVDDEILVRRIGRTLLSKLGYDIVEASDGLEALEICRAQDAHIDLVLLDLTMPKLTGKETFARLQETHPQLPVLICSGYLVDLNEFTHDCGACPDGFVQKPYRFEELAEMVRQTLDRHSRAA